jgi:hypothetical protein
MVPRGYRVVGAVLGFGLIGLLIWSVRGLPTDTVRPLGATIVIDPGGETFGPAPDSAWARVGLTPDQVLKRYTQLGGKLTHPSGNTTVYLGQLTFNDAKYLVYGFATHDGCANANPEAPPSPPQGCTEWWFIDAELGALIDQTSSPTSGIP